MSRTETPRHEQDSSRELIDAVGTMIMGPRPISQACAEPDIWHRVASLELAGLNGRSKDSGVEDEITLRGTSMPRLGVAKKDEDVLSDQALRRQLKSLELERARAALKILALEVKHATAVQELETSKREVAKAKSETKKTIEKRDKDYERAVVHAKMDLTHGWDMDNQLLLFEIHEKEERIRDLEQSISRLKQALTKSENTISALEARVRVSDEAKRDPKYRNIRAQAMLQEWAIKTCIIRCIVAIVAKKFAKATSHASEGLKLASAIRHRPLIGESAFWHGVALCHFRHYSEAVVSLCQALSCSGGREDEAKQWYSLACDRSLSEETPPSTPSLIVIRRGKNSRFSAPSMPSAKKSRSSPTQQKQDIERQHAYFPLSVSVASGNNGETQMTSLGVPVVTRDVQINSGVIEEEDPDAITPRASRSPPQPSSDYVHNSTTQSQSRDSEPSISVNSPESMPTSLARRRRHARFSSLSVPPSLVPDSGTEDGMLYSNDSVERHLDGQTFASIDELIGPHIVEVCSPGASPPADHPNSSDAMLSNPLLYSPYSLTERRQATTQKWCLTVPAQHRDALPTLLQLPSGKRSALPVPAHELPATPPESFSPEDTASAHLRRTNSWGDMRSLTRDLSKNKKIAAGAKTTQKEKGMDWSGGEHRKWDFDDLYVKTTSGFP